VNCLELKSFIGEMEMNKGYKIVIPKGKNYSSACIFGKAAITYKVGEWTKDYEFGPLIFTTLEDAIEFVKTTNREEWEDTPPVIFECEYDSEVESPGIITANDASLMTRLALFKLIRRAMKDEKLKGNRFWLPPFNTIVTHSIKLIKIVWDDYKYVSDDDYYPDEEETT
jgi:hypothetical protein